MKKNIDDADFCDTVFSYTFKREVMKVNDKKIIMGILGVCCNNKKMKYFVSCL